MDQKKTLTEEAEVEARDDEVRPSRRELLQLGSLAVASAAIGCGGGGSNIDGGVDADLADGDVGDGDIEEADADADLPIDADDETLADAEADSGEDADIADADEDVDDDGEVPIDDGPLLFLHFSDTHIGAQDMSLPALTFGLTELKEAVHPNLTVISGDLVDEGDDESMWEDYEDGSLLALSEEIYEIPGNHDTHGDYVLAGFLRHSLTGQATAALYGQRVVEAYGRKVRVIGLNTASGDDRLTNLTGYLEASQVDDLIARIEAIGEPVDETIIFGHHPMRGLNGLERTGTAQHLRRLIEATGASAYLFGHVHMFDTSWNDGVLHIQNATLGNPSFLTEAGFEVLAVDDFGPTVRQIDMDHSGSVVSVAWPKVLITTPVDQGLGGGHPNDVSLPRAIGGQRLRAAVFCPGVPDDVAFRIEGGEWQTMVSVEHWYEAEFETGTGSSMSIEVRALFDGGTDTHRITVPLS